MSQNKFTLPPECFACGEESQWKLTPSEEAMEVKGEKFPVATQHYCCSECSYEIMTPAQMKQSLLDATAAYQKKHDLITASETKRRRAAIGLNQAEFCQQARGVELASLKRLEAGQRVQNDSTDVAVRAALEALEKHHKNAEIISFATMKEEHCRTSVWDTTNVIKGLGLAASVAFAIAPQLATQSRAKTKFGSCQAEVCMNFDEEAASC